MNAVELKSRLNDQAESVCRHLLPSGRRQGHEWVVGDVSGTPGESMAVHLDGRRAGLWADFAHPEHSGDIIDLWMSVRRISYVEALGEISQWLGVEGIRSTSFLRPRSSKPVQKPSTAGMRPVSCQSDGYNYLVDNRGIDPEVIQKYRVAETDHPKCGPTLVFPCFDPDGKCPGLLKFLAIDRGPDGRKQVWSSPDSRDHLFGWQAIKPNTREVVITEGEIDALSVAGWGFAALSLPRGVNSFEWLENDFEALERFEKIHICTDGDDPGRKCAVGIADRLGRERCYLVSLPSEYKDANAALMSKEFDGPDFETAIADARPMDPDHLRRASDYADPVRETFWPSNNRAEGTEAPIDLPWRARPGELTIWTGFSGHGKSLLLSQFIVHDLSQDERACVASFEIPPAKTLSIMVRQVLGHVPRDKKEVDGALRWLDDRVWFLDHRGPLHWSKTLPVLEYAARRYGCTRFAIDSLLFCGIAVDDYAEQKRFVSELIALAVRVGAHVHLVAHSKKADSECKAPGKFDVKGTSEITDIAHNGFTVWRNKSKEEQVEMANINNEFPLRRIKLDKLRDGQLSVWKNRESGEEPFRSLWLHKPSMTFRTSDSGEARCYHAVKISN